MQVETIKIKAMELRGNITWRSINNIKKDLGKLGHHKTGEHLRNSSI